MALIGIFLLIVGAVLNVVLLRRASASQAVTPGEVLRSWPWRVSLFLVLLGVVCVLVANR
jgi:hypothetical protein